MDEEEEHWLLEESLITDIMSPTTEMHSGIWWSILLTVCCSSMDERLRELGGGTMMRPLDSSCCPAFSFFQRSIIVEGVLSVKCVSNIISFGESNDVIIPCWIVNLMLWDWTLAVSQFQLMCSSRDDSDYESSRGP